MTSVSVTAPDSRTGTINTEWGNFVITNGAASVDVRCAEALQDAGFEVADIPDLSDVSPQTMITLEAPPGFSGCVIADGVKYQVVDGTVTLPRQFLRSLVLQGYSALTNDGGAGLPVGATAHVDYQNGTFSFGNNTFADFLYENTSYGTWEGDVVPGTGFVPAPNSQNISIGAALTAELLATGTITVVSDVVMSPNGFLYLEMINLPEWTQDIYAGAVTNGVMVTEPEVSNGSGNSGGDPLDVGATLRIVSSLSATGGCRSSVNGGPCASAALTGDFIVNFAGFWLRDATIKNQTFYGGAKTNAELEALSTPL